MRLNKTLKRYAKQALKGHWLQAVSVTGILLLFEAVVTVFEGLLLALCEHFGIVHFLHENIFAHVSFSAQTALELIIAVLCGIISLLFLAPILIGEIRWQCNLLDGTTPAVREIFYFFKTPRRYFKSVYLVLRVFLQRLGYGIGLTIVPITAFAFSSVLLESTSQLSQSFGIIAMVLGCGFLALGLIWFVKIYLNLSLSAHVLAEDENIGVGEAIKISRKTMHKNEAKLLMFELSLLLWRLLELLVIPALFVLPYCNASRAVWARYFLKKYEERTENKKSA